MKKPSKSKKILVTGSAGFIGFHLCEALLKRGYSVVGVDSMSAYYDVRIKEVRTKMLKTYPTFKFVKLSTVNYSAFEKLAQKEKPTDIVHLAAQAGVRYSLIDPWTYAETNYLGTMNVFEAARRLKLPRVIYASSSSVYGSNKESPSREEDRTDSPISLYAATKRGGEILATSYNHLFGTEMIGLRFFTVYGPWGRPDMALFKFVRNILKKKSIALYNRGKMRRSFTYVSDIVDGIVSIIETKPKGRNEIYNLGGSETVPLTKFVELIEKKLGSKVKKVMYPLQQGDIPEVIADCSKAKRDLAYEPSVSIEQGISNFVEWFMENKTFLLSLKDSK